MLRIAQEALNNALRHADAERIELRLAARDGRLTLTVADDGVGFDPAAPGVRSRRLGLTSMEERAPRARRRAGGRLAARRGHDGDAGGAAMIRVLIADDHAVVRQGLRTFLDLQDDIEVVGEAADGEEALALVEQLTPDVVLIDLVMPRHGRDRGDPAAARQRARRRARSCCRASSTTTSCSPPCAPARPATCSRTSSRRSWCEAIRTVHGGGALLHPQVAARLLAATMAERLR